MGVFARLFRRSRATEEASVAGTPEAGSVAADESTAEATGPAGAGTGEPAPAVTETAEAADPEGVGIPKQQSAGEAVDNEADKGART
ncbi:hypothetical protein AB0O68_05350 [Streptomyces sp. NPDC087512]|uniref:hypothetical protein n=1 Tax=Streptomyces sp. NPDC087512 TaxID=3155059 RepID=UPI0034453131